MAFGVEDFQDLLRLLEEHPQWQAELRRRLLTDELLELPALVRQLTERLDALTERVNALAERVDALAAAQVRTEHRLEALTERVNALAERVDALAAAQARTEHRLADLIDTVAGLSGESLEFRYVRRAGAYFSRIARRIRLLDPGRLADRLDGAVDDGRLTQAERNTVLEADIVLEGRRREDQVDIYLLVEVSRGIARGDVERAAERSRILAKLGRPALAVVAGERIASEVEALAAREGVWRVLDGRVAAPEVQG